MSEKLVAETRYALRIMLDDASAWSRAQYPATAVGRYRDAAYEIHRLRKEVARLSGDPVAHSDPTGTTREPPHCPTCGCGLPGEPSAQRNSVIDPSELWSFIRDCISQGTYIQMDANAGKYKSTEEVHIRLDGAARERIEDFVKRFPPTKREGA